MKKFFLKYSVSYLCTKKRKYQVRNMIDYCFNYHNLIRIMYVLFVKKKLYKRNGLVY